MTAWVGYHVLGAILRRSSTLKAWAQKDNLWEEDTVHVYSCLDSVKLWFGGGLNKDFFMSLEFSCLPKLARVLFLL